MGILVTTRVGVGLGGGEMADFNYDFKVLVLPIHFMPLGGKKESLEKSLFSNRMNNISQTNTYILDLIIKSFLCFFPQPQSQE